MQVNLTSNNKLNNNSRFASRCPASMSFKLRGTDLLIAAGTKNSISLFVTNQQFLTTTTKQIRSGKVTVINNRKNITHFNQSNLPMSIVG